LLCALLSDFLSFAPNFLSASSCSSSTPWPSPTAGQT
jgi:hypothetical protein